MSRDWPVMPALLSGQFAIMDAEVNGQLRPVAVAFWALVSPEVDQRLSDTSIAIPKLAPKDWRCGDIPWLLDVVGHRAAVQQLMAQLNDGPFAGQVLKVRRRIGSAPPSVSLVGEAAAEQSVGAGNARNMRQVI